MGRSPCCEKMGLRWTNYLRPDIKRGNFTPEEEEAIIRLHQQLGNRRTIREKMSTSLHKNISRRTDNEIKNVWHTHLKKRLPQTDQSTTEPTSRKRARKSKPAKKGDVPEAPKLEHVNCVQLQGDEHDNDNDNSNNNTSVNVSVSEPAVSPRPCTSSSTETSTVTSASEHNYDNATQEMVADEGDYFGDLLQIDNDFWSDVLLCIGDTAISTENYDPVVPEPYSNTSPEFLMMEPQGLGLNSEAYQDDMEFFWYHLLIRSNELTELSQVL
ncbi:hypothetical protein Cgig2_033024 [Carnegiea gigantea]|uniref:Uncharacterized protein n=1 Tax=Carnegiea gigantea TaxID=171969 RepID=A0A9Q1K857_9CARY|nr:hypothetical protein Cgig2_033024 [Carnegiea gigantea]